MHYEDAEKVPSGTFRRAYTARFPPGSEGRHRFEDLGKRDRCLGSSILSVSGSFMSIPRSDYKTSSKNSLCVFRL